MAMHLQKEDSIKKSEVLLLASHLRAAPVNG
jgi:hypothetical protein